MSFKDVTLDQLQKDLFRGINHSKPENCPGDLYNLMLECWKLPENRPTFHDVIEILDNCRIYTDPVYESNLKLQSQKYF